MDKKAYSLNPDDADVRGQEIRLNALALACDAGHLLGRMDGPIPLAIQFEQWIRDGSLPKPPAPPRLMSQFQQPPPPTSDDGGESDRRATDMIDIGTTVGDPPPAGAPSLKQATGKGKS